MEVPYLFHCLPVRVLLAFLQVYLLGFLSLGGTAIDAWYAAHPAAPHPLKLPQLRVAAGANASSLPSVPPVPPLLQDAPGPTIRRQVFSPAPPAPGAAPASAPAGRDVILLPELPFAPPAWPFQRSTSTGPEPSPISPSAAPPSAFSAAPPASPPPPQQPLLPPANATVPSANAGVSPSATPPSTPAECDRLDAELTGLRCFEAADAATRDRCRRLAACHPLQPDPVDVQRVLPPVTQPCVNNLCNPRVRSRTLDLPWSCTRATTKYFYESRLSNHLDGRWGRLLLPPAQRQEELGKLFQAWSAFTAERGLQSWLFAGSLIGWFFNKQALPWDDDLDVQVLASHLRSDAHYLKYDRTAFQNRYYFEINPNSASRTLDWNNIIDARFIDKSTGIFIDIVAVSFDPVERMLKCKKQEPFNPAVLFPLRRTTFMGAPAWVPRDPGQALIAKYSPNVVLHQQPQPHPTAHCPALGPCTVYAFDPAALRWVYQPPSPGLRRPTGLPFFRRAVFPLVRPATRLPPQPSPPLAGLARLNWLFQNPL